MTIYQSAWMLSWTVVAASGVALSITGLPVAVLIILAVFGSGAGLLTQRISRTRGNGTGADRKLDRLVPSAGARAGAGACFLLALSGLSTFIGSLALLLAVIAVITSPWVIHFLAVRFAKGTTPAAPPLQDDEAPTESILRRETVDMDLASSMKAQSYESLCRTWRTTYLPVRLTADPVSLEKLLTLRRACLDELERRDPTAFRSWFHSQPRASGSPEKFLNKPRSASDGTTS